MPRRPVALLAILAVAWGALWPLVSAAGPKTPRIPNFICTQGGPHASPEVPAPPGDLHGKFHCPLCIMAGDAPAPTIAPHESWMLAVDARVATPFDCTPHASFDPRPPPSRAPPALS